jgi:hypothetical protein
MNSDAIEQLRRRLKGEVISSSDNTYDEARAIWNGTVDKRPAVIARCEGVDDVVAAVNVAREHGLGVSVRGGGHHVAGSSLIDGGLVVDLSSMRSVEVDPARKTVRCDGGTQIGDLDRATQAYDLAVPMGVVSATGIAGLTLGGGLGWMRRKHGLSCDNLIAADVVTADGTLVHASVSENEDLFWALRGGGWDMGAVVSFEFQAHDLGPEVWVTFLGYPWSQAKQVLKGYREYATTAPEGFSALCVCWTVPEIEEFPREAWGQPFVVIVGPYAGTVEEGREATKPLHGLGTPLAELSGPMPWVEAQSALFDEDYPDGRRHYWRSTYLRDLPDEALDALIDLTEHRPSLLSSLDIWQLGGAIDRVAEDATPIAHRGTPWLLGIEANWDDPADDDANQAWTKDVTAALAPFSAGGSYMNFEDPDDTTATRAAYGTNTERLRTIKQRYDPENLFRSRQGLG